MSDQSALSRRALLGAGGLAGAALLGSSAIAPVSAASTPTGQVVSRAVLPSDRQGFNRRWFAPNLQRVYIPRTSQDVAACLEQAVAREGRGVKVVSGRHCYEGFVYSDDANAIIDMSALDQAGWDPEHQAYFIQAGCENWAGYRALLNSFGRTLPGGSCASVGAGGHIAGGGYGLMSRKHGLTIDHVTAVDIVTWDDARSRATLRHISESSTDSDERDLFWAVRGAGGGNYGIITTFYFANPPVAPAYASLWNIAWDWSDLTEARFSRLLSEYSQWVAEMPTRYFTLLKLNHSGSGQISMLLQMASEPDASLNQHLAEVGDYVTSSQKTFAPVGKVARGQQSVQHLTFLETVWTLSGNGPNQFGKYKSAYLNAAIAEDQVAAMYKWLRTTPEGIPAAQMGPSLVQVDSYGGAVNNVLPTATALPQRSALLKLQFQTYWNNASRVGSLAPGWETEQEQAHLSWMRNLYSDTFASTGGTPNPAEDSRGIVGGCYYNYPDVDLGTNADGRIDEALWLYFLDNYRNNPRNLVGIKQRWDPTNLFRHAQSIPTK